MPQESIMRCPWCEGDALMMEYHDNEWGVPVTDDQKLFEYLVLDTSQAGLSWKTILHKRENYRKAFDNFDAEKIAQYDGSKVASLLLDEGIIRNKLKITGTIKNAQLYLETKNEFGSFSKYIWSFVGGVIIQINHPIKASEIRVTSPEAIAMSKDMKKRGFTFCGPTICYAFMQAAGLVDDHLISCFRK